MVQEVKQASLGFIKVLGQSRPANTTAVVAYVVPQAGTRATVHSIYVANTTSSAATFRIHLAQTGSPYDETNALFFDTTLAANTTVQILDDIGIPLNSVNVDFVVRTGTGNALTFTIMGRETV